MELPPPRTWPGRPYGRRPGREAEPYRDRRRTNEAKRFSQRQPDDDRKHQRPMAADDLRHHRDACIREREHRQHHVAGTRAGMAQQPVGRGFQPTVDRIERPHICSV
jgi:hypothetical protein